LLSKKYILAIISNAISEIPRETIEKSDLNKYFTKIVISRDLGIRKPDPDIFNFTLSSIGVKPEESIHIGDSLYEDILGAKNVGMKTIWINKDNGGFSVLPDYRIHSLEELPAIFKKISE
jgi:putative hydrolase of the HAD superfamily